MEQHLKTNKHKKAAKNAPRKNSLSTDDGASSAQKDTELLSDSNNPFEEEFVDKTLTENTKIEEPRMTSMDSLRICLFCNKDNAGVKKNLDHMRLKHSFLILDIDCLISLKALLHYFAEKVHVGHCCLNCNRAFKSTLAVQNHMKDMCHCCMNTEELDDEYEYFYDFSPTYEEDFVGKKLEDFDLTEEPLAKPISEKIFSKVEDVKEDEKEDIQMQPEPMPDIVEETNPNDDDWEDLDCEDAEEGPIKGSSVTESFQKISTSSASSFTIVDKPKMSMTSNEESLMNEEAKSLAENGNLTEAEVAKLLDRRRKNRFDYQKVTDNYKKAYVLDTGEVQLPNGKQIGHRQWAREYKQRVPFRDIKEAKLIRKLGIEYRKLGACDGTISKVFNFNHHMIIKKFNKQKDIHIKNRYDLKVAMTANKVNQPHFRRVDNFYS